MNIKIKKIRQLIREALRSDKSTALNTEEIQTAVEHLLRTVFEVAMTYVNVSEDILPALYSAVIESPDYQSVSNLSAGGIGIADQIVNSYETLIYNYEENSIMSAEAESIREDEDEGWSIVKMPSERFIKSQAKRIVDMIDSEETGDPSQISYGRPYEECLDAMMNLVRLVFEIGMARDSVSTYGDERISVAISESPDAWVLHIPLDYDPIYGRMWRSLINNSISSIMLIGDYLPEFNPKDKDVVVSLDNRDLRYKIIDIPSDEFIKDRADNIISIMRSWIEHRRLG